jgi:hypothetical protein
MKTLKTLMLASLFAVPAFAQAEPATEPVKDQVQTQARVRDQKKDGECDGTHKRQQLRDGSGGQARHLMKGERQGGGRMGRK